MSGEKAPTEGWGVLIPGERRHHYYVDGRNLCGTRGFYNFHLSPDDGTAQPLDCKACRRKLRARQAKSRARG